MKLPAASAGYLEHVRAMMRRSEVRLQVVSISAWCISVLLNPAFHRPLPAWLAAVPLGLAALCWGKAKVRQIRLWCWGTLAYAVLLAAAFRLEFNSMPDQGRAFVLPVAILITLGFAGLIPLRRYYGVMALAVWLVLVPGADKLPLDMARPLAAVLVLGAFAIAVLTNSAVVVNLRATFQLKEDFRRLAEVDPVTEMPNRRAILQQLEQSREASAGFHFAMLDLDDFKQINDRFGHEAGDMVLRSFAAALKRLPENLFAGRLGGEEFAILLHDCSTQQAHGLLEAFLAAVRAEPMAGTQVSFSAGCVRVQPAEPVDQILRRADHALYAAKRAGKARVMWDEPAAPERRTMTLPVRGA